MACTIQTEQKRKSLKATSLALLFFLTLSAAASGQKLDLLILKDSTKVYGTIIEHVPNQNVIIRLLDQTEAVYRFDQIETITSVSIKKEPKSLRHVNYWELGVNFGFPSVINISGAYMYGPFAFRLSGMYYHEFYGVQLNAGIRMRDNEKYRHVLTLLAGRSSNDFGFDGVYGGFAWNFYANGFFLEVGGTYGKYRYDQYRSYYEFDPAFQIGYSYRFVPGR